MKTILSKNLIEIKALCNLHNVKSLFVFGSVMTDKFDKNSDIDLLISFKPHSDSGDYADNYFSLVNKFEKLFQRSVDLITDKSLSNPYFIQSINKTKTLLYGN
ncbi:MAG: nucleotidyltransferase domain-containing protein [Flavobacteriaceae bacterium]|nr:nucleotidyltransferase domain-containing protein [Flavobacteriaceae bacterium]